MPALLALALLTGAALGLELLRTRWEEREAKAGRPKGAEHEVVDIEVYPDDVLVKVYIVHGAYEAQVYWSRDCDTPGCGYLGSAGGFTNVQMAKGWGRAFARNKGAAV